MDTQWTVKVNSYAQSDLDELDDPVRRDALAAIRDLEHDPFPPDVVKIRGANSRYRIKFYGNRYRIIYQVSEHRQLIIVLRVRSRDANTYSGF